MGVFFAGDVMLCVQAGWLAGWLAVRPQLRAHSVEFCPSSRSEASSVNCESVASPSLGSLFAAPGVYMCTLNTQHRLWFLLAPARLLASTPARRSFAVRLLSARARVRLNKRREFI